MTQHRIGHEAGEQSLARLRAFLTERVAGYLGRPPAELDPAVPLSEYGLDSMHAVTVCGDIEDEYGVPVDPTLIWDNPSIDALSAALSGDLEQG